jgi:hypothetical protein
MRASRTFRCYDIVNFDVCAVRAGTPLGDFMNVNEGQGNSS